MDDAGFEKLRVSLRDTINDNALSIKEANTLYDKIWSTEELKNEFEVEGFLAPFVAVTKKATGEKGALMFQHSPRFYFNWTPSDSEE